jgi:glycosyltransferase involved in cell wall biosynthesis
MNPSRLRITDYHPARVTICLLVHIPEQIGYFAHRLDVLKLCLRSILTHTEGSFELLVFDNGSCLEVVDYLRSLQEDGAIQYLFLSSRNIGISSALKIMFSAAPGEIIAYSQDDVLFLPGWLQAHLEILDTYPRVGMVSGMPVREQFRYGNQYLPNYLSEFPEVSAKYGHFIPDKWERDFYESGGRDVEKELETIRVAYKDILLEYKGIKAYSTAVHFQYVARKSVILQGFEAKWEERLMVGPDVEIDKRIDILGYARLSTNQRYVRHIGNIITHDFEKIVASFGLTGEIKILIPPPHFIECLLQKRIIRGIFKRLNNWSYFMFNYHRFE